MRSPSSLIVPRQIRAVDCGPLVVRVGPGSVCAEGGGYDAYPVRGCGTSSLPNPRASAAQLKTMDGELSLSRRVLHNIINRARRNKVVAAAIMLMCLGLIGVIIYLMVSGGK